MSIEIGLDQLKEIINKINNKKFTVFCNTSSVNSNYINILELLNKEGQVPKSILGPQHGFIQDKQDNMIESYDSKDALYNIPIYSLYGKTRIPEEYMFRDVDIVLIDIQDVGSRYYTYISSIYYIIKIAKKMSKKILILDRVNPISSVVEGSLVEEKFRSFVGISSLPNRHGMTIGELSLMFNDEFNADIEIIKIKNYKKKYWDELDIYKWIPSSPNMPKFETTLVYPGQCLLEATNISEGRGTTTPFEIFGTPYIEHKVFLNSEIINSLVGVCFRPISFVPTFNKFKDTLCNGFFMHITNKDKFKPLKTSLAVIYTIHDTYKKFFKWKEPPYEYEYKKLPIDILLGKDTVRKLIEAKEPFESVYKEATKNEDVFLKKRNKFLLY